MVLKSLRRLDSHLELRSLLVFTLALHFAGFYQLIIPAYQDGILFISRKWWILGVACSLLVLLDLIFVILSWTKAVNWIEDRIRIAVRRLAFLGWLNVIIYSVAAAILTYLVYGISWGLMPLGSLTILAMFWSVALVGCLFLRASIKPDHPLSQVPWIGYLGFSVLLTAFIYRISSFFPDISSYPFTLTWSETSRFYYASLFFAKEIYGFAIPPTVLHPSRYLLQSLPFLLPDLPLWLHRTWQVILWVGFTLVTSLVVVRRLSIRNRLWQWLSVLWIFLFLLIGPVYYHLQVPVILVCLGFNRSEIESIRKRNFISFISILLASAWAGISRVNWFPVPGMLAVTLWLLEVPVSHSTASDKESDQSITLRDILIYLLKPAGWFLLSVGIAFLSQGLYILWSGNPASEFTSSFSSGLLWYRLWPNPTFILGILPGILLLSFPSLWIIALRLREFDGTKALWRSIHIIRLLGLAAVLVVLFITGLIVSVKIGGGSNLHNMDSYLVLILVISASFFYKKVIADRTAPEKYSSNIDQSLIINQRKIRIALGAALSIVVLFSIFGRGPVTALPDQKTIDKALKELKHNIEKAKLTGGEILFLSNRHLITFEDVEGVQLVPEYERVFLMEMAMAGNTEYLERFHNELREHRFSLIISEPLFLRQKDENEIFGEENNAWVQAVSRYVLCYYKEENRARAVNIQFFTPNSNAGDCP